MMRVRIKKGVSEGAEEGREGAEERLDKEKRPDPHERGLASDPVGDSSRAQSPDEAADHAGRTGDALQDRPELEGGPHRFDGGVEDHALEAVEERAECRDECEARCVASRLPAARRW